jgi:hypothetical protein
MGQRRTKIIGVLVIFCCTTSARYTGGRRLASLPAPLARYCCALCSGATPHPIARATAPSSHPSLIKALPLALYLEHNPLAYICAMCPAAQQSPDPRSSIEPTSKTGRYQGGLCLPRWSARRACQWAWGLLWRGAQLCRGDLGKTDLFCSASLLRRVKLS